MNPLLTYIMQDLGLGDPYYTLWTSPSFRSSVNSVGMVWVYFY